MAATELSPKQRRAITALIEQGDIAKAAKAAEVSRNSIYTWLKEPAFSQALREAEGEAIRQLGRQLVSLGKRATGVLAETMDDQDAHPSTRLRAADVVIGRLLQLRELVTQEDWRADVESRLSRLEEKECRD